MRVGALLCALAAGASAANDRPIIGVYAVSRPSGDYIAASYVKWLEQAGARVVPIPYQPNASYSLEGLFNSVNGLLFTGGDSELPPQAQELYNMAVAANNKGDHFPVWGTCLGFQWIVQAQGGKLETGFDAENLTLALNFTDAAKTSRLFAGASPELMDVYATNVTLNNHHDGFPPAQFEQNSKLAGFFNVLSTNKDRKSRPFVSTIEAQTQPIHGIQWHPEKNQFEWGIKDNAPFEAIQHTREAVAASAFLANFFVSEARKNSHHFPTLEEEYAALIYNYRVYQTGPDFSQEYHFDW
mmetsp:Transcript_9954/g.11290  ORF Transcript_9954/g.11290 Transcript_9954/m.11290 type:complete len:298 (-) Transcript_9954:113-1006(-)|eukprot:CAMPEP_0205832330 /NCGR_PEP_ID=MMETSP0206-20130828/46663_1 /ASSEMBLY_ACC=CAM_ASM_000279 /TAXON_ID=36767 /ORGANISM="Euplotes focardii, Strain TN1" /LENGTH=297 /DNA_ID=CAMNT_0053137761 /DNA_START=19 /DNA_END=909 /DNA_ORIENTATION=-